MKSDELLKIIQSQGYWRVEIHSTEYQPKRLTTPDNMREIVSNATVSFRGWPYPYYAIQDTAYNGQWLEGNIDWENYQEHWRFYESGQWLHFFKLRSIGKTREEILRHISPPPPPHAGYIHVRGDILFELTEICRFAAGLVQSGILNPMAHLSIGLHNTKDYILYESIERFFPFSYTNTWDEPIILEQTIQPSDLSIKAENIALEMAVKIYNVFGWSPAESAIRNLTEDQKKLIERRL